MGLPGSGKTYLTERLVPLLNAAWYNADKVRAMSNDWDFSDAGRTRQSMRMRTFADFEKSNGRFVVCDFVCPTKELELTLLQILLFGWIPSKKEDSKTPINSLRILKMSIFILLSGMNIIIQQLPKKF